MQVSRTAGVAMASVVNLAELIAYESLPFVFSTKHLFFATLPSEVLKKIQKCLAFCGYMGVFGGKAVHRVVSLKFFRGCCHC